MTSYNKSFDEDLAFEEYKQKRLTELQHNSNTKTVETYYDEYKIIEKTKKDRMIVHFYDDSFEKCKIMDHNLTKICKIFKNIEFVRIDANISPILTSKLQISVLPFIGMFRDGFFVDHIIGFEGLGRDNFEPESLIKAIRRSKMFSEEQ